MFPNKHKRFSVGLARSAKAACHPERIRSLGEVKDLPLLQPGAKAKAHGGQRFLRAALPVLFLLLALPAHAQELSRRLILKDGSYQLVTKYELKGDRVRFLSSERDDWEELPASLVDWPATEKYERDRAAGSAVPEAVQLDKEIEQENQRQEALLPEVAPGLRLPEDSGVFLLDNVQGEAQVVEIQQTAADVGRNGKGSIFRGLNPVSGMKQTLELDGPHAPIQSHVDVPSIYLNIDAAPDRPASPDAPIDSSSTPPGPQQRQQPQQPQQRQQSQQPSLPFDRFRIVKTEVKGDHRVLGNVKRQLTGKISEDQHAIKTTIARVTGGWLKITPAEPMPTGEYALVEFTGQEDVLGKQGMNLYVWDFGVNPKAPANANSWKPDVKLNPLPPEKVDK